MKDKRIYSPYNELTIGRTRNEDKFINPDFIDFTGWVYVADEAKLGKLKYAQHCEILNYFNYQWGSLSNFSDKELNGTKFFTWDNIHQVKEEAPNKEKEVKTKEVIKEVEVKKIPKIIAQTMTVKQLLDLLSTWGLVIDEKITNSGKADIIKKEALSILDKKGYLE